MRFRPYNDPEYRAAKAKLTRSPAPCWECGKPATTPDHWPPLAEHEHVRGARCCILRPHCRACSDRQGGKMAHEPTPTPAARWFG